MKITYIHEWNKDIYELNKVKRISFFKEKALIETVEHRFFEIDIKRIKKIEE